MPQLLKHLRHELDSRLKLNEAGSRRLESTTYETPTPGGGLESRAVAQRSRSIPNYKPPSGLYAASTEQLGSATNQQRLYLRRIGDLTESWA